MVSPTPEERVTRPCLTAGWVCQTFLHWRYEPRVVQALLPPGVVVDTFDGAAWVGLTPFVMASVRQLGLPRPRWTFPETNLRTYVRLGGRPGLWFLSLEVTAPPLLAARGLGIPYHLARLRRRSDGPVVRYAGERYGGGPSYRLAVRPGDPLAAGPLDTWLTARWRAYSRGSGVLWETPVEHEPWRLRAARVEEVRQTLTASAGLPPPEEPPLAHFSPGVRDVRLAFPRPVSGRRRAAG
ncbi:YqjF family protein [Streptomyces sp. URMC 126]|uniref:YqjF family protein n=1 Tax=Streptomyces sp. URMC 126 TaxID=3423401 RepID=UPI003F1DA71E